MALRTSRIRLLLLGLLCCFTLSAISPAAVGAASSVVPGTLDGSKFAFGYVNESGKRVLSNTSTKPARFTIALFAPGSMLGIKYIKHQKQTDKSNGRQTMWNFDQDEGDLFTLPKGHIEGNSSVLLAEKKAFQGQELLKFTPEKNGKWDKASIAAIEKAKKRKVIRQRIIGHAGREAVVGVVEFARVAGKKPLASLVLSTKSGLVFQDFVGNNDKQSTWRVDDGGVFQSDSFGIVFLSRSKAGFALAYDWQGFEGSSLALLQQKGTAFRTVAEGYRYTSPV
ncbi:hypothetical protein [Cohnella soli]|uniref:Uncharacterized protein n=1 Tax=Cohnella soli TaxID=425005 RepID=A0ABW0HNM3_9BACL